MSGVPVYSGEKVIANVKYNSNLDRSDGSNWNCGSVGLHLGITKLKNGQFVLIHGTDWQGGKDRAEVISNEEALQEILKAGANSLLEEEKFAELKELYDKTMIQEA
jgi:hypothetical protein